MVKVIVDKNALTKMVEVWIRFTIVEDKPRRETPKEWQDYLIQLHERWNKQKKIWWKKWLPKTRKLLNTHKEAWNSLYWDLCKWDDTIQDVLKIIKYSLSNYIKDIKEREEWWYGDHRFTLYEYIKQKNWLKRFIAK